MIDRAGSVTIRKSLKKPFGFKGACVDSIMLSHVRILAGELEAWGSGVQSVLWSDAEVFRIHGLDRGDALMHAITRHALFLLKGEPVSYPPDIMPGLFEQAYRYGIQVTGLPGLRKTFVLNALVPVDHALWLLYARNRGMDSYDTLLERYRDSLCYRNRILASVPLITYKTTADEIQRLLDQGFYFLKIKIGNGLEWDKARVEEVFQMARNRVAPHVSHGRPILYLDANGMYPDRDTFARLVDHLDHSGILASVGIIEEPFPEEADIPVGDFPVRIAADESCHTAPEAIRRMDMGYGALALKPIAKTLTFTLEMLSEAVRRNVPCFCADLTVPPLLVEWNKQFAARMKPFPGTSGGILESNGPANYTDWEEMVSKLPLGNQPWVGTKDGIFRLDDEFYSSSSGIFLSRKGDGLDDKEV